MITPLPWGVMGVLEYGKITSIKTAPLLDRGDVLIHQLLRIERLVLHIRSHSHAHKGIFRHKIAPRIDF